MFDFVPRQRGIGQLRALLAANRGRGEFRLDASGGVPTIFVYDAIVACQADADWIGGVAADTFVQTLMSIDAPEIAIRVNSPGGDVFAAVAMSNAMRQHKAAITVHVDGYAASAASILMVNADRAVIAPGGFVMIHNCWTLVVGNAADFREAASLMDKIDASAAGQYAAKAGGDPADWTKAMTATTWYTAAEAQAAGLVDAVDAAAPKARIDWDLSAYGTPPAAAATETTIAACTADAPCLSYDCATCAAAAAAAVEAESSAAAAIAAEATAIEQARRVRRANARLL